MLYYVYIQNCLLTNIDICPHMYLNEVPQEIGRNVFWTICTVIWNFSIISTLYKNKKLSYRRETARQLPTSRGGGLDPPVHSPSSRLHLCVWSNPKATTYVRPYVKRAVR